MKNVFFALLPVVIILVFIYRKDKYEKEPLRLMSLAFFGGILAGIFTLALYPVLTVVDALPEGILSAFFQSFYGAAIPEEGLKFLFLYLFIWKRKDFNEKFDGILYAVMVAMGFAGLENLLYLLDFNIQTAIGRAILSVPGHALFGVIMGYYFALARFSIGSLRRYYMWRALFFPILAHGFYNFLLFLIPLADEYIATFISIVFIRFIFWLWQQGFEKIETHLEASLFKPDASDH